MNVINHDGPSDFVRRLHSGESVERIADDWLDHGDWMKMTPPPELLAALLEPDGPTEGPVVDLVRTWDRDEMTPALLAALADEHDPARKVRAAWHIKVNPSPRAAKALLTCAGRADFDPTVRSYLLEAVDRLVAGGSLHWEDIDTSLLRLSRDHEPTVRDAVVGVLMSTSEADEEVNHLLMEMLADTNATVLASVLHALEHVATLDLDPELTVNLMTHPDPRVSRPAARYLRRGGPPR